MDKHIKGAGYQGTGRKCCVCDHPELKHFGAACYYDNCSCGGFWGRKPEPSEMELVAEQRRRKPEMEWHGDPFSEFTEFVGRSIVKGSE